MVCEETLVITASEFAAGHRTADLLAAGEEPVGCREMGHLVRERLEV